MRNRWLYTLIIAIVLAFLAIPTAQARHYLYLAEDEAYQYPWTPLTDNWAMVYWNWGQNVLWGAEPTYGGQSFVDDARATVANWQNAIPQLGLVEADPSIADIVFYYLPCPPRSFRRWVCADGGLA